MAESKRQSDTPWTDADRDWLASELPELASPGGGLSFDRRDVAALALDALAAAGRLTRPGVWELPAEPPEHVREVWDRDGHRYRLDRETWTWKKWLTGHRMWVATELDWVDLLLTRAPLSATPPEGGDRDDREPPYHFGEMERR